MRIFEAWRDSKTNLFYWRLTSDGREVCKSVIGVISLDAACAQIRYLALDFAHTGIVNLASEGK